jgi:photosystem II stability/assembly factor-like uncharacterized protein
VRSRFRFLAAVMMLGLVASLVTTPAPTNGPRFSASERLFLEDVRYLQEHGERSPYVEAIEEQKAPEDSFLFERLFAGDPPNRDTMQQAADQAQALGRMTKRKAPALAAKRWKFVGPANIGARVVDMVMDPKLKNTLYVASASGGIWKSTDDGTTFGRIWPNDFPQSMGALAIASDGTLYAGTGETNPGGGSLTYGGDGVYRSDDRGKTWKHVGLSKSSTIGRIAVHPKDPDHVFVGVSGNLFTPGGQRGLYESKNGGRTWKQILEPDNDTTGAADLQIDPENPDNIYVAMWEHIRYPDRREYAGVGSGIFRSQDGGKSFDRLGPANGLPPGLPNVGRIGIGLDPQDPARLYAIYIDALGTFQSFFVSSNGGDTWVQPPTAAATLADSQSVYGWWFARIWVDPRDSDHVWVAGLPLMESLDGGMSFPVAHSDIHVDHHAMVWDPHKKDRVYNGNDGGVYRSDKNGEAGSWVHGKYQPWSQFFTIDVSEQDPTRINGGLQDQGSVRSWGGKNWNQYNGGDGVKNAINPKDKDNVFACSQYGSCVRSDDGGNNRSSMTKQGTRDGWLTPIEFDPKNTDVMYWAGDVLNRSEDRGQSWTAISPDLGELNPGTELNPLYAAHYGTVQAIGLNAKDPDTIYAGTDSGLLWKTTDLGGSWDKIGGDDLPERWITHVEVEPKDPDTVYVSFSGFREGDDKAYVFRSGDGGESWKDISAKLPKAPVTDVVLVGNDLYASTDVGVFVTDTKNVFWYRLGRDLPLSPVNDLRYVEKNDTLYAGTFGRGIYAIRR